MTHKVARNTREILNKQEAISVLLEISQCFMAQMTGITAGFHMSLDRLAPMWQQSGTLLFCSCHGIAGFLVDELQI